MTIEANPSFIKKVFNSWHYLGCPHVRFNENLHSMYRQGSNKFQSIQFIESYLLSNGYNKLFSSIKAKELYDYYMNITLIKFNKVLKNLDTYANGVPKCVTDLDNEINTFFENSKTYYWNGVLQSVGSYTFKNKSPY